MINSRGKTKKRYYYMYPVDPALVVIISPNTPIGTTN